jgi:hypothetical protein
MGHVTPGMALHRSSLGPLFDSGGPGHSFSQQLAYFCKSRCEKPEGTQIGLRFCGPIGPR